MFEKKEKKSKRFVVKEKQSIGGGSAVKVLEDLNRC